MSAAVQDNLSGIKEIQIFTRTKRERLGALSARYAADQVRARKLDGALQPTMLFFSGVGMVVVAFFGGRAALGGVGEMPTNTGEMTVENETPSAFRLCSVVSKAAGDDPCSSGTPFDGYLGTEAAPPWKRNACGTPARLV